MRLMEVIDHCLLEVPYPLSPLVDVRLAVLHLIVVVEADSEGIWTDPFTYFIVKIKKK